MALINSGKDNNCPALFSQSNNYILDIMSIETLKRQFILLFFKLEKYFIQKLFIIVNFISKIKVIAHLDILKLFRRDVFL